MFKKPLFRFSYALFFFVSPFSLKAQKGIANYKLTTYEKGVGKRMEQNLIIYFDKFNSVELRIKRKDPLGNLAVDDLNQVHVLKSEKPTFVFKDFSIKKNINV